MSRPATASRPALPAPLAAAWADLRRHGAMLVLFSAAIALLLLMPTVYMLQVYDRVLSTRNATTLALLTLLALGVYALMAALEAVRSAAGVRLARRIEQRLAPALFDAAFANAQQVSPALLASDLATLRQTLAGPLPALLLDTPLALVFLAAAFVVDPWLGAVIAGFVAALALLGWWHERRARGPVADAQQGSAASAQALSEALRQAESARGLGMAEVLGRRWLQLHGEAAGRHTQAGLESAGTGAVIRFVRLAAQSAALAVGALLVLEQHITPGMMIAASLLLGRALAPVEGLVGSGRQIAALREAWSRLQALLQVPAAPARLPLPAPRGALATEALAFQPAPGQPPLLVGVQFELAPGEVLAVVGPSGAGKSTLVRLLAGALPPSAGSVRLDGAELAHWPAAQRGAATGYLPQDVDLFDGTVAENIARLGAVDAAQVVRAAQRAGVHEMVLRLPQGYETRLGAGGLKLSGGQRQRIGLARALYGEPVLLLLDEPNSHLDDAGELALRHALSEHKARGGSAVVVSHRLPLLQSADRVLVLQGGRPTALGARDEVLKSVLRPMPLARQA